MRTIGLLLVLAACGGSQNTGPVPGAREARDRHYPVTIEQAHSALRAVLKQRYGIKSDDGRHIIPFADCRDSDGDECTYFPGSSGGPSFGANAQIGGPTASGPGSTRSGGAMVGHYWFQVYVGIVGIDGDVQIQLGARVEDFKKHVFAMGEPGSPAWMPHEVDEVRVAVDHALAQADR
jgi:hypothetical protein